MPDSARTSLSHLKFRHLMLVDSLVELGTLHKAAARLNISQPAASGMLIDLENLVGFALFERNQRGTQVTPHGIQLLDKVRTLLHEFDDLTVALEQVRMGHTPALRVGLVPQAYATHLPVVIETFRARRGGTVRAEEGTSRQLLERLLEGDLDCVIGRLPASGLLKESDVARLEFENLYTEQICVVAGMASASEDPGPPYTLEWLGSREWVLQRRDSSVRNAFSEMFMRQGLVPPSAVVETTNYMQSLALVVRSPYYTVAPRDAAKVQQRLGLARILDWTMDVAPMQVSFIHRRASRASTHVALFRDCFRQAVQDAKPPA
jgi:DNA-binding transcriptional LysR family regulator